jgi:hypothetical protein
MLTQGKQDDVHAYCGVQHDPGIKVLAADGYAAKYDVSTLSLGNPIAGVIP